MEDYYNEKTSAFIIAIVFLMSTGASYAGGMSAAQARQNQIQSRQAQIQTRTQTLDQDLKRKEIERNRQEVKTETLKKNLDSNL